jgi:hypothetical protein
MTAADYDALLRAEGYVPGLPRRHRIIHQNGASGAAVDGGICARATCAACGHEGLRYAPYTTADGRGYRALAVCPACAVAEEW